MYNFGMRLFFLVIFAGSIVFAPVPNARAQAQSLPSDKKTAGKEICVYKKDNKIRCRHTFTLERFLRNGKVIHTIDMTGVGDYDKYTGVGLHFTSEMEEKNGLPRPLKSVQAIYDKTGELIVEHRKDYDYLKKKIYYQALDKNGKAVIKKTFPIKGLTIDDVNLSYFLKAVVSRMGDDGYHRFYVLSSEPSLYNINIQKLGDEEFDFLSGKAVAAKIRLVPDFGIATGVYSALVPPTYFWFKKGEPCNDLAYEGLETSLGSAHVVVTTQIED